MKIAKSEMDTQQNILILLDLNMAFVKKTKQTKTLISFSYVITSQLKF